MSPQKKKTKNKKDYYEGVGRRKNAVARARIFLAPGKSEFLVNNKTLQNYFPTIEMQAVADAALRKVRQQGEANKFSVKVKVSGGGLGSQAEAVRHGTARALIVLNPEFRPQLKRAGYLRRDPRKVERKKFGLKKARRAPQWQKR